MYLLFFFLGFNYNVVKKEEKRKEKQAIMDKERMRGKRF